MYLHNFLLTCHMQLQTAFRRASHREKIVPGYKKNSFNQLCWSSSPPPSRSGDQCWLWEAKYILYIYGQDLSDLDFCCHKIWQRTKTSRPKRAPRPSWPLGPHIFGWSSPRSESHPDSLNELWSTNKFKTLYSLHHTTVLINFNKDFVSKKSYSQPWEQNLIQ